MPSKPANPGWKTGEQLEFLLSQWKSFKRAQDAKTLDKFWPRVFEEWFTRWPVPSSPSLARSHNSIEEGRLALQKAKNTQIKQWFNNKCRGMDSVRGSRGDLKLDTNGKRKLAPVQAYCSYAWPTLRPIVLTRWEQQKRTDTFDDDDDPPVGEEYSPEACIPLAFKLKIAKELYDGLTAEEKKEIDRRREEDKKKMYRKIPEIDDDEERNAKLRIHQKNQPFIVKALNRVLMNLEDQTGCVAQLFVASVDPAGGAPSIQKFCQGSTKHGLKFETFYGEDWDENVENKFRQWALRIFGEKGSEQRDMFLLPEDAAAPSEASSSGPQVGCDGSPLSQNAFVEASVTQNSSADAIPSKKSKSRSSKSRKSVPQPSTPEELIPHPQPAQTSTLQAAAVTSDTTQSIPTPGPIHPIPHASIDPPADTPNPDGDIIPLFMTANTHQLLPQVPITPQVGSPNTIEPSQLAIDPSQLIVRPSQAITKPSQEPSQALVKPPPVTTEPPQSVSEPPKVSEVIPMDTRPDPAVTPPSQPLMKVVNATSNIPVPGVPYRVRNTTTVPSEGRSRRDSIDGAPEMVVDSIDEEITVDLRNYISFESDDETHVSSSQKSVDECRELSPPPSDSQRQSSSVGTTEGNTSQPGSASSRTLPQLDVDEDDFLSWMMKKGQWRYVVSTAGGTAWEGLLKLYINQERRLEFTDLGVILTTQGRPSKIPEYFQYAHQPSRGDTLTVPDFGLEVAEWWRKIQPEWRRSDQDPPQSLDRWSYILSGGSKGAFLLILCLAWWDRAHERHVKGQKEARRAEAETAGVVANFDDLPDHDAKWLSIVNDVAFVMRKAQDSTVPTRKTSGLGKRKKDQDDPVASQQPATKRSSRKRSKV